MFHLQGRLAARGGFVGEFFSPILRHTDQLVQSLSISLMLRKMNAKNWREQENRNKNKSKEKGKTDFRLKDSNSNLNGE
jgi:hypothetical protein